MGNMVAIHNIVAVSSVLGLTNQEGEILRHTVGPMLLYGVLAVLGFSVPGVIAGPSDVMAWRILQMAECAIRKWFELRLSRHGLQGIIPHIAEKTVSARPFYLQLLSLHDFTKPKGTALRSTRPMMKTFSALAALTAVVLLWWPSESRGLNSTVAAGQDEKKAVTPSRKNL